MELTIERALFSLDCGLHPLFNLPLGTTRLPFEYFENRCLYLAIWLHMESLGRRGCWRTALEFNKLLFAYGLRIVS
jgi:Transcriptional repressor TCF25